MNRFNAARKAGFTLLEVMIALAVLAVASAGLVSAVSQNVRQGGYLEEKTLALWVAGNRLAEMRVARAFPGTGRATDEAELGGREWKIQVETSETSHPGLRRVEVSVAPGSREFGRDFRPIVTLTGFLGQPQ